MIGKFIDLIGRRAGVLVLTLALLATSNVAFQMMTHKTTALTAWKGGGFGMYTEPHVEARSVWLTFSVSGEVANLRLWPEAAVMTDWRSEVGVNGDLSLGKVTAMAERFRYYPRLPDAQELLALIKRIRWRRDVSGGLLPLEGTAFEPEDLTLEVFENAYDVKGQKIDRVRVYGVSGAGGA